MTDPEKELRDEIYREICELPCSNSGVISLAPERLRNNLSTRLIEQIAKKAAEVALRRASLSSVGEGWKLVPVEPTEEQWSGLARDIVMWSRWGSGATCSALRKHLVNLGRELPGWLLNEIPDTDTVPPKGTVAVIIYKAMLAAAPVASVGEGRVSEEKLRDIWDRRRSVSIFPPSVSKTLDDEVLAAMKEAVQNA